MQQVPSNREEAVPTWLGEVRVWQKPHKIQLWTQTLHVVTWTDHCTPLPSTSPVQTEHIPITSLSQQARNLLILISSFLFCANLRMEIMEITFCFC